MYNTILVPLDGSKRAEAILAHVEQLAHRFGASVVLLQVIEPVPLLVGLRGAEVGLEQLELGRRMKEAKSYLAALKGEFREKGIDARTLVDYGPVVNTIIEAAKSEEADLIALASHGRTGLSRVYYGSVAAGVLHRVDRPLLLVRSRDGE
jgi:nucleotide-binding universal stress UspA family protein